MSNKSLFSLAFIIGAATGSVATWYLLKDKYEALAQEEIDSVKEVFLRREQELKDQSVKKTVAEGIKDADKEKPDLKEYAERLKKEGYETRRDYQNAAIVNCEQLINELQRVVEIFDVDLNLYNRYVKAIDREIGLIKRWRQRDMAIKSRLEKG